MDREVFTNSLFVMLSLRDKLSRLQLGKVFGGIPERMIQARFAPQFAHKRNMHMETTYSDQVAAANIMHMEIATPCRKSQHAAAFPAEGTTVDGLGLGGERMLPGLGLGTKFGNGVGLGIGLRLGVELGVGGGVGLGVRVGLGVGLGLRVGLGVGVGLRVGLE
jgi:hypothetical protein